MPLPWVRLDANFYSNPKVLLLLEQEGGAAACVAWLASLAFCGGHGTDGFLTKAAAKFVHADERSCFLLTEFEFWEEAPGGYEVHDWTEFQESNGETQRRRKRAQLGAAKTNCRRWHPEGCDCWRRLAIATTDSDRSSDSHGRTD